MMSMIPPGIILIRPKILLIMLRVHLMRIMFSMSLCLQLIHLIHPLRLSKSINLTTHKAGDHFFGESVADWFSCWRVSEDKKKGRNR